MTERRRALKLPQEATTVQPRWEALSVGLFAALLCLYPASFRAVYAGQMTQVFRASCVRASREGGVWALARLWRFTLGDLLVSALAERLEQEMSRTLRALYRASGLVALVGVAVWVIGGVGLIAVSSIMSMSGSGAPIPLLMTAPAAWLFFVIGLIGLYALLAQERGAWVWLPGVVAIGALLALVVAELFWTYNSQIGVQQVGSTTIVNLGAATVVNQQLDYYAYVVTNVAYPVLGLALFVTGLLTLRLAAVRMASRMLLTVGALGMLYYFFTDMGAPSLLRNTGAPGVIGLAAGALVFFGAWLVGWVLLGRWLWRAGALPAPSGSPANAAAPLTSDINTALE